MVKICKKCKKEKDESEYYKYTTQNRQNKLYGKCKSCYNEDVKNYENNNRSKVRLKSKTWYYNNKEYANKIRKEYKLLHAYNLNLEQREQLLIDQDYKCKCCNCDLKVLKSSHIHIDHDHSTGKIRGILCLRCNTSLGLLNEEVEKIKKLLDYAIYCKTIV